MLSSVVLPDPLGPTRATNSPALTSIETSSTALTAALFETGRPILVAPPKAPATVGRRPMLAWADTREAADAVRGRLGDLQPVVGLVLGSGLGSLGDEFENAVRIPFKQVKAIRFRSPAAATDAQWPWCSIVRHP